MGMQGQAVTVTLVVADRGSIVQGFQAASVTENRPVAVYE